MRLNIVTALAVIVVVTGVPISSVVAASATAIAEGKTIAVDRRKGNCLACHMMDDGKLPGNTGPPLISMAQRFPEKAELRKQIWDPTVRNPQSMMPPFGKHGIISEDELDRVVDYIHSL